MLKSNCIVCNEMVDSVKSQCGSVAKRELGKEIVCGRVSCVGLICFLCMYLTLTHLQTWSVNAMSYVLHINVLATE